MPAPKIGTGGATSRPRVALAIAALTLVSAAGLGLAWSPAGVEPPPANSPAADTPAARRVLDGLADWQAERPAEAVARLAEPGPPALEDWRLLGLAESLAADGRTPLACERLAELFERYPASPLRTRALERALELAIDAGLTDRVHELIVRARDAPVGREALAAIESAAWEAATAAGDRPAAERAARRLLVEHPLAASKLAVVEQLRQPDGAVEWASLFTVAELERRARNLLDLDLAEGALKTLDFVPEDDRGVLWKLLRAEALTAVDRGAEALELLDTLRAVSPEGEARLARLRADAALEAARIVRGRASLSERDREALVERGREQLRRVVDLDVDPELTAEALRRLFDEADEDAELDARLAILTELRRRQPTDTFGAPSLWRLGWQEYERRNLTRAIGTWAELRGLYPESTWARAGDYWSGRAHERLGHRERALALYREVAAVPVDDFYGRFSRRRIDGDPAPPGEPRSPTEPWPSDPRLARAERLVDAGLGELAVLEIRGLDALAEPRAARALEAQALAAAGRRRDSIISLKRAFPQLGTPQQIQAPARALEMYYPLDYAEIVGRYAATHGLPEELVFAMIRQESAFDAEALSRAGARGLMQLMPATGRELAGRLGLSYSLGRLTDPEFSVRLGTAYFRQVLVVFDGNQELALAGYNAGPNRIRRLWARDGRGGEVDSFVEGLAYEETRTYVKRVLLFAGSYRQLYGSVDSAS